MLPEPLGCRRNAIKRGGRWGPGTQKRTVRRGLCAGSGVLSPRRGPTSRCPCGEARRDDWAVRWLDGTDARPLVPHFADDHHAFHEDAKPGDLSLQLPTRSSNSLKKFWTTAARTLVPLNPSSGMPMYATIPKNGGHLDVLGHVRQLCAIR